MQIFPHSNFLHATAPTCVSTRWKAIVVGKRALETGLIYRVGDGASILTWTNPWILTFVSLRPMRRTGNALLEKVSLNMERNHHI